MRKNVSNSQENGVGARCAAIVNHPAVLKILRVVTTRTIFSTAGSFAKVAEDGRVGRGSEVRMGQAPRRTRPRTHAHMTCAASASVLYARMRRGDLA